MFFRCVMTLLLVKFNRILAGKIFVNDNEIFLQFTVVIKINRDFDLASLDLVFCVGRCTKERKFQKEASSTPVTC